MKIKEKFSMLFNIPTLAIVLLTIALVVLAIVTFSTKDEESNSELSPTEAPTTAPVLNPTPTPKPEINYGDKDDESSGHKVEVDPTDRTPKDDEEDSMYDRDFDSEKYVTYEDGKVIFNFDEYTKDAVTGDSEEREN